MLLSFSVENFRSILKRQELTLLASRHEVLSEGLLKTQHAESGVLPALAIFGANGTGKTTILRAIHYVFDAICNSQTSWKPGSGMRTQPHYFHQSEPTRFECRFIVEKRLYRFKLEVTENIVLREALYMGRERLYSRNRQRFTFGPALEGYESTRKSTRENSLFLSAIAQNNHPLLRKVYAWFNSCNLITENRYWEEAATARIMSDEHARSFLAKAISVINPQIIRIEPGESLSRLGSTAAADDFESTFKRDYESWMGLKFVHQDKVSNREVTLRLFEESRGTQSYLALVSSIMVALSSGSPLLLDEADLSLHPMLLKAIVLLFQHPQTNPRGAQLIFNTHDTTLLNPEVLRPDQVWFASLDPEQGTQLYSLADFGGIRSDMRAQRSYLEGRFGAIPFLDDHMRVFAEEIGPRRKRAATSA